MTIQVGQSFPSFNLMAVDSQPFDNMTIDNAFVPYNNESYADKWLILLFYPNDFTFVCPTEIMSFSDYNDQFGERNSVLVCASTDTEYSHYAWRKHHPGLRDLPIHMLADVKRELTQSLGILDPDSGVAQRAIFIVDPNNVVRFSMVTDMNVGRNPDEIMRVLDALQTDAMCGCNWQKGDATLTHEKAPV